VINKFDFVDQPRLRATRLVSSGRQSAVPSLIKEAAVGEGDPLGRLITEIGQAARAGWAPTARLIILLAVVAAAVALVLMTNR
jgi:hypothetical protein